jgi:hypothetical protein
MFDAEFDLAGRQTDLVIFLDGFEPLQKAVKADTQAFRQSWKRPKWHIILQNAEAAASRAE